MAQGHRPAPIPCMSTNQKRFVFLSQWHTGHSLQSVPKSIVHAYAVSGTQLKEVSAKSHTPLCRAPLGATYCAWTTHFFHSPPRIVSVHRWNKKDGFTNTTFAFLSLRLNVFSKPTLFMPEASEPKEVTPHSAISLTGVMGYRSKKSTVTHQGRFHL